MAIRVRVGPWTVRPDVRRTRVAHAQLDWSGAEECSCAGCRNFSACRPALLGGSIGDLLATLGITPPWEAEAIHLRHLASGLHAYEAAYQFVGTIESEPPRVEAGSPHYEPLEDRGSIRFHHRIGLVRQPFEGLPLVQLAVRVEIPWVIGDPEMR